MALEDLSKGFYRASIKTSIEADISGFLIVSPIRLKASEALSLIAGWALLRQPESVGTIIGSDVCSCLAEQFAIIPKIQI